MFGIGLSELMVIAFVAVIFVGPEKVPELARQAGRFLSRIKLLATATRDELRSELGPEFADMELRDLDPRNVVRKHVMEAMREAEEEAEQEAAERGRNPGRRSLDPGELPPFDIEAT